MARALSVLGQDSGDLNPNTLSNDLWPGVPDHVVLVLAMMDANSVTPPSRDQGIFLPQIVKESNPASSHCWQAADLVA